MGQFLAPQQVVQRQTPLSLLIQSPVQIGHECPWGRANNEQATDSSAHSNDGLANTRTDMRNANSVPSVEYQGDACRINLSLPRRWRTLKRRDIPLLTDMCSGALRGCAPKYAGFPRGRCPTAILSL